MNKTFISSIHTTDPNSAAKALSEGYGYIFGISRETGSLQIAIYGYKGKEWKDLERDIARAFFEDESEEGEIDPHPSQESLSYIWQGYNLKPKRVLVIVSYSEKWVDDALKAIQSAKASKRMRRTTSPIGAANVTGTRHKGYTYKTAKALIDNVIAKRQPSLFDTVNDKGLRVDYVNAKGKPVILSPLQMKLITALAQVLDTQLTRDDVDKSIDFLTFEREQERAATGGKQWKEAGWGLVSAEVDIAELARLLYSSSDIGGKEIKTVSAELFNLSHTMQLFRLRQGEGKKGEVVLLKSLIHIRDAIGRSIEDNVILHDARIIFEDLFVYQLKDKYSLAPITLLNLWNSTGNQTELFALLLFLLQGERGFRLKQASYTANMLRRDLKKSKTSKEEIDEQVASAKREALTYKETFASICERLSGRPTYYQLRNGKSYLRHERVRKDLAEATADLLKVGIISDYYETFNTSREQVCNFVLNDKWLTDETKKVKYLDK